MMDDTTGMADSFSSVIKSRPLSEPGESSLRVLEDLLQKQMREIYGTVDRGVLTFNRCHTKLIPGFNNETGGFFPIVPHYDVITLSVMWTDNPEIPWYPGAGESLSDHVREVYRPPEFVLKHVVDELRALMQRDQQWRDADFVLDPDLVTPPPPQLLPQRIPGVQ